MTTLVWIARELRLADNPALHAAAARGPVLPVFVLAPEEIGEAGAGGAQRWWLHRSLEALEARCREHGVPLALRTGPSLAALKALAAEVGAKGVMWNERPFPAEQERDGALASALREAGLEVTIHPLRGGALLHDPSAVRTGSGKPYTVFTPFWKKLRPELEVAAPLSVPKMKAPDPPPVLWSVESLGLLPKIHWYAGMDDFWQPGEVGGQERLRAFLKGPSKRYGELRDTPGEDGTSRLSPYLHFGEVSPRQAFHAARRLEGQVHPTAAKNIASFVRELGWREFCHHVLLHNPHTVTEPLKDKFAAFPWRRASKDLEAWRRGRTGFPIVDAGMRQLWHTGWMHNRVRMVVASFLTKHLLVHWREGASWFQDTLVDADLANNVMGWQWAAGSGADAQPFFRIFNPMGQGKKFDPEGAYVRRWVPELAKVDKRHIHEPWEAGALELKGAGVTLGKDYPEPVVDHKAARQRALDAFEKVKG